MAARALRLKMPRIHFLVALFFVQLWSTALTLNQEGRDLLQAKLGLDDPHNSLSDWNPSDSTPCNWTGITCSISQVTIIDLSGLDLAGPFPAALCRLPKLSFLSISLNYINSTLQDASLLPCSALTHLDLSENLLIGSLPASLSSLPLLHYLDLSGNNFTGAIPPSFAFFPSLQILSLTSNLLNESIPPFLGNISSLKQLNLSYNPFLPGSIPFSLANLTDLQTLWLAGCSLIGQIPSSLGSLSALVNLDLSSNFLTGAIPNSLSGLSSVVQIEIYNNSLSGNFPSGLSNLTALRRIDAAMNRLSGNIPDDLFSIPLLDSLHLYQNQLSGSLPPSAGKASKLSELRIFSNLLSGSLPADLGANSPLTFLDLSDNKLTGEIPKGICQSGALKEILLINNHLSGSLPEGLGQCRSLTRVRLSSNRLSGQLPAGMWGLPYLWILELTGNSLSGSIAPSIAQAANLSNLLLAGNQLSGSIPVGIGMLSKLYQLSASDNRLSGPLPASLGQLPELGQLDLRNNSLSGKLLTGIQSWKKLTQLNLADNAFSGGIPPELGTLPVLTYLDLSGNELNGEIPIQLQNLKLNQFNLSYNQLSGPIPPMFQNEAYQSSFVGNPGLCGDFSGLCSPSSGGSKHAHGKLFWVAITVILFAGLAFIVGISLFCWKHKNIKRRKQKVDKTKWTLTSFHKLGFSEYEILKSLDEDNVIGSGSSGKVYKVVLGTGEAVAVKKLWETKSSKSNGFDQQEAAYDAFESEVSTLGKIRHKNIVKLWCCCSHRDCKLLVYEFMPNGSLGDLLHSSKARLLDWPTRLKIAVEAAEGLCYLHHDCVPPIVHRDVKSNNILLDAEFGVKVSDFGVAKAVDAIGKGFESMSVIAGSCGYIAPEYAYTLRVNEKSDIYSFGVVLLELITGKRSVGPELGEKDLVNWVCGAIQQEGEEHVYDSKLESCHRKEIARVLRIALLCTSNLPINRPSMRRVVKMLLEVSADTNADFLSKDAFLSPYYYGDDERNVA